MNGDISKCQWSICGTPPLSPLRLCRTEINTCCPQTSMADCVRCGTAVLGPMARLCDLEPERCNSIDEPHRQSKQADSQGTYKLILSVLYSQIPHNNQPDPKANSHFRLFFFFLSCFSSSSFFLLFFPFFFFIFFFFKSS